MVKTVKVAAFLGSPRTGGNNAVLLDEVIRGVNRSANAEVQRFVLNQANIYPCQACNSCTHTGRCVRRDDMDLIYTALDDCDLFLLAAPIFFSGLSAQAKMMIDRCQPYWAAKYVRKQDLFAGRKRWGSLISTCGQAASLNQFAGALQVMNTFYLMLGLTKADNLFLANIDEQPAAGRTDELARAYRLGQQLGGKFG
ncbi:MAG TPA: flavodoxin family protein [Methylomusa anaerophila]|uniref:Putative NAD(P)H-dependent FMN-containing oxidoreductase YwqN n=1 Tax=Methylomusa anaerophila TaxID=1930071 RepID=A0A348AJD8_9FIRM|nr:flavodoxin family protein [Methylomusa anaerophila]BBB91186.1 putative NAD(P)H-dependent FMN-containing oxidoreductase YwqN [Methylomusa anaerophila]HML89063.1 flavodoxin family protein [Methylomusa anaerophila]